MGRRVDRPVPPDLADDLEGSALPQQSRRGSVSPEMGTPRRRLDAGALAGSCGHRRDDIPRDRRPWGDGGAQDDGAGDGRPGGLQLRQPRIAHVLWERELRFPSALPPDAERPLGPINGVEPQTGHFACAEAEPGEEADERFVTAPACRGARTGRDDPLDVLGGHLPRQGRKAPRGHAGDRRFHPWLTRSGRAEQAPQQAPGGHPFFGQDGTALACIGEEGRTYLGDIPRRRARTERRQHCQAMRTIETQGRRLHAAVPLHPWLTRVKQGGVGHVLGDMGECAAVLRLQKLETARGTTPADGVLPARPVQLVRLGEMRTEVPPRSGRHRLQGTPHALRPCNERRRTCETTAEALMAIPALREPVGQPIPRRAGGSSVVRGPGRLT